MSTAKRKLKKDLRKFEGHPPPGIIANPSDESIFVWQAVVWGSDNTPFEGGSFSIKLKYTTSYPNKAPIACFYSKMFHPNVYPNGKIGLDILEDPTKWNSEHHDVSSILSKIKALLGNPNTNKPANPEANRLFLYDPVGYKKRVEEIVQLSNDDYKTTGSGGYVEINQNDLHITIEELELLDLNDYLDDIFNLQVYQ